MQRLKVAEQSLRERSELQLTEAETWRNNSERLTASMSRKDAQLHELTVKLEQIQAEVIYRPICILNTISHYFEFAQFLFTGHQSKSNIQLEYKI